MVGSHFRQHVFPAGSVGCWFQTGDKCGQLESFDPYWTVEQRQSWAKDMVIAAGIEQGNLEACRSEAVTMGAVILSINPCNRKRRRSSLIRPRLRSAGCRPRNCASNGRSCWLRNPSGYKQKSRSTARSACTRGSPKTQGRSPLAVDLERLLQCLGYALAAESETQIESRSCQCVADIRQFLRKLAGGPGWIQIPLLNEPVVRGLKSLKLLLAFYFYCANPTFVRWLITGGIASLEKISASE